MRPEQSRLGEILNRQIDHPAFGVDPRSASPELGARRRSPRSRRAVHARAKDPERRAIRRGSQSTGCAHRARTPGTAARSVCSALAANAAAAVLSAAAIRLRLRSTAATATLVPMMPARGSSRHSPRPREAGRRAVAGGPSRSRTVNRWPCEPTQPAARERNLFLATCRGTAVCHETTIGANRGEMGRRPTPAGSGLTTRQRGGQRRRLAAERPRPTARTR
jgi:hypothetical protein